MDLAVVIEAAVAAGVARALAERPVERETYNLNEAATVLGVDRSTIPKLIEDGTLTPVDFGDRRLSLIPRHQIDALLAAGAALEPSA